DAGRQGHAAVKGAVGLLLLALRFLLGLDREGVIVGADVDVVRLEARHLRVDYQFLLILRDVEVPEAQPAALRGQRAGPVTHHAVEEGIEDFLERPGSVAVAGHQLPPPALVLVPCYVGHVRTLLSERIKQPDNFTSLSDGPVRHSVYWWPRL